MAVPRVWGKLIFWIDYIEKKQKDFSQSFGDAWLFTLLSLHAMAGPEISGAKMKLVRNREDLKPVIYLELYLSGIRGNQAELSHPAKL